VIGWKANNVEQVVAHDWETWIEENDGVVLDVREPNEWAQGMLPESMTISLAFLPASLNRFDRDRPILVVCRSGNRSMMAANFLQRNGYRAANMTGGLVAIGLAT
jgi:rhodanese-related sulfurtransferase